ncbi:MAG: hypothetical protein RBU21_07495 [FCB group bacterium]|jgi:hypothetical protein|nr:hypothetical protein [FCB group bacterium]
MAAQKTAVRKLTEDQAKELGEAFGGTVVRVNADEIDNFFLASEDEFSSNGRTHYLRLMGIGKALYDNQTDPTRVSILAAQKNTVRAVAEGVYTLRNTEGKYFYAALASRLGWEDPREFLDLTEKNGWVLSGDDEKRGLLRFSKCVAPEKLGWRPAVFADVPYLYSRPLVLSIGLYNESVDGGMRDTINTSGKFRFKMDEFASDDFRNVADALAKVAKANEDVYGQFLDALRRKLVLIEDARTLLRNAAAEKRLPRFQTSATLKYLDVLERGGEVDVLAPKTLKSMADLAEALALYGRENAKGSLASQTRAETGLFTTLFEDIYEAEGGELPPYTDLKEHVAQQG